MHNIVGSGMGGPSGCGAERQGMDPQRTAEVAKRHSDVVVDQGGALAGPEWIAVDRGVEAGELAHIPVMVDFATFRPERRFRSWCSSICGRAIFIGTRI